MIGSTAEAPARVAIVFQRPAVFAWKSVPGNTEFGCEARCMTRAQAAEQAREMLALVGLQGFAGAYPHALSGGLIPLLGWVLLSWWLHSPRFDRFPPPWAVATWIAVIAPDDVGAQAGLGMFMVTAQSGLETTQVMAGMAVIGVIGLALSLAVSTPRRVLVPYEAGSGW
ncbi:MAG: hypothetical protein KGK10_13800 [Rhodospirillales bacterium]|nr:hypothetical protein [Rhodospirillales bacterium]